MKRLYPERTERRYRVGGLYVFDFADVAFPRYAHRLFSVVQTTVDAWVDGGSLDVFAEAMLKRSETPDVYISHGEIAMCTQALVVDFGNKQKMGYPIETELVHFPVLLYKTGLVLPSYNMAYHKHIIKEAG